MLGDISIITHLRNLLLLLSKDINIFAPMRNSRCKKLETLLERQWSEIGETSLRHRSAHFRMQSSVIMMQRLEEELMLRMIDECF